MVQFLSPRFRAFWEKTMQLNDNKIKALKPSQKPQKFADGGGLQLLVHVNGSKYFQFRYSFEKKDKLISFGTYPEVTKWIA